mgnify:CR=1 FL=1
MAILNIRPAKREGAKLVIGLAGHSGSGKTLTALYIARGMVDHAGEIGFLDTENKRGSLYANELDAPFLIGDLFYPFSPERYADAIKEFQQAGVKVLIIDSISHEWESGCMEIAELPLLRGKKMADWKKAKSEHKKLMTVLLQSDMHIICCIRAAEKMDFTNPAKPVTLGVQPLCEKNFMFEMTASVMMFNEGTVQQHLKVPKDLKPIFGNGNDYLGQETGSKIREWAEGNGFDEELMSWENKLQLSTNEGSESLKTTWLSMPDHIKDKLKNKKRMFWTTAVAIDEQNKDDEPENPVNSLAERKDFTPGRIAKENLLKKDKENEQQKEEEKSEPVISTEEKEEKPKFEPRIEKTDNSDFDPEKF